MSHSSTPSTAPTVDPNVNYYEILNLIPTSHDHHETTSPLFDPTTISSEQIKSAYKQLAKVHHPDRPGGNQQVFEQVNTAYEILMNDECRKQIDAQLVQRQHRMQYERQLSDKSRTLRQELERREKRFREENVNLNERYDGDYDQHGLLRKKSKLGGVVKKEEIDRIKTTGYDALKKIQEEHRKRQEELMERQRRRREEEAAAAASQQMKHSGSRSADVSNVDSTHRGSMFIARWKEKVDAEQIESHLSQMLGPIEKFVKLKGKKKAIVSTKSAVSIQKIEGLSFSFGLSLEPRE